jgi:hypothetical protein
MGHDISGFNKEGEEIAYARFSMGNYNATILYDSLSESVSLDWDQKQILTFILNCLATAQKEGSVRVCFA